MHEIGHVIDELKRGFNGHLYVIDNSYRLNCEINANVEGIKFAIEHGFKYNANLMCLPLIVCFSLKEEYVQQIIDIACGKDNNAAA